MTKSIRSIVLPALVLSVPLPVAAALANTPTLVLQAKASPTASGTPKVSMSLGFSDSAFEYGANASDTGNKSFCYTGSPAGVCTAVRDAEIATKLTSDDGAHDWMEVRACGVATRDGVNVVTADYTLHNDYSHDIAVRRDILPCDMDGAATPAGKKTTIYGADASEKAAGNGSKSLTSRVSEGFGDSSFNKSAPVFCYLGPVEGVCAEVQRGVDEIRRDYEDGGHSVMDLGGCRVDGAVATVTYALTDDYGGARNESKAIAPCSR